ncbi:hypothetical protein LCGC14_1677700 [marine sediment metagenome]|uniref:dATP/dGTP diphosphohydrolase N-terminal domain-containing protein n=1 Tax=marine sediment metagenome TaxID=412755 RepID=A0A0F9HQ20_9ZZZZ
MAIPKSWETYKPIIPHEAGESIDVCFSDRPIKLEVGTDNTEYNQIETTQKEGIKFDEEKLRWDLLPYDAIEKIVEIITYGAKKYKPDNWKKVDEHRYIAALMRHLVSYLKGEDFDKESGFSHLAHVGCNILFLIWIFENKIKTYPEKSND